MAGTDKKMDREFHTGHRQRLRQKLRDGQANLNEVVEFIIACSIPRRDVRIIARNALMQMGGPYHLIMASRDQLLAIPGVGDATADLILAMRQLFDHAFTDRLRDVPIFTNKVLLENYCRNLLMGKQTEEFHVLYMDKEYRLIRQEMHSRGTIDETASYPREILRTALMCNAVNIILLHNHPSGDHTFSTDDYRSTAEIIASVTPNKISVFDHLLVADTNVVSMKDLGCGKLENAIKAALHQF